MSIKTFITSALLAVALQGAQAAPHTLVLEALGGGYSAGLSTQAGSPVVTHTQAGAFRDEFLIHFNGVAQIDAWLDTSADLAFWSNQGITFTRAGFVGIGGSDLVYDISDIGGTRFTFGYSADPFEAHGDFLFFVEGVAGDPNVQQTPEQALRNSFSYSGGINLAPVAELPEPASFALASLALAGAFFSTRRRSPR
ncbi:FxDxF family PEP-CTERM protein [Roseateles sp. LYH14W]|uniref:FxDxF family PEP-CTERM protein n=1 Tax=Pelomonas parva TaxID=3299032 RepID=A0ABW7F1E9_9BURK